MSRPATKTDLIQAAEEQFDKMWKLVDSMTPEERNAEFHFGENVKMKEAHWQRDRNIRDILVHLYEWHQLLLNWEENNKKGLAMPFIPAPYNWKTYGQMNVEFWKKHQDTSYEEAREMLLDSHRKVMELIKNIPMRSCLRRSIFPGQGLPTLAHTVFQQPPAITTGP